MAPKISAECIFLLSNFFSSASRRTYIESGRRWAAQTKGRSNFPTSTTQSRLYPLGSRPSSLILVVQPQQRSGRLQPVMDFQCRIFFAQYNPHIVVHPAGIDHSASGRHSTKRNRGSLPCSICLSAVQYRAIVLRMAWPNVRWAPTARHTRNCHNSDRIAPG